MSATAMLPSISPAVARRVSAKTSLRSLPEATRQYKMVRVPAVLEAFWAEFPEARRLWREDNGTLPLWDPTPWAGGKRERCTADAVLGTELAAQTAAALAPITKRARSERVIRSYACAVCGAAFEHPRSDRKYCSLPCLRKADRERTRARWQERAAELRRASDAA